MSSDTLQDSGSEEQRSEEQRNRAYDFFYCDNYFYQNCMHRNLGDKLAKLKKKGFFTNQKPRLFKIGALNCGEKEKNKKEKMKEKTRKVIEILSYFHEKGIVWEKGEIEEWTQSLDLGLVHTAITMNVFKKLDFRITGLPAKRKAFTEFCQGISSNNFTEELGLEIQFDMKKGCCLALNNLLLSNTPCFQKLKFNCMKVSDYRIMLPGLRNNKRLKSLNIHFHRSDNMNDEGTSQIVAAVAGNPNLESLKIFFSRPHFSGELSSEALERLLTDSTSLKELKLHAHHQRPGLNAESIIQGLKNSRSLKRIEIRECVYGDLIFARFFRVLPDCPVLEHIQLRNYKPEIGQIDVSEEDLAQVKLMPRLPRTIHLELHEPDGVETFSDIELGHLAEILQYHPEVRLSLIKDSYYGTLIDQRGRYYPMIEFWHAFNMNWHGRYLLDRPNVPLSIWPLVLEKVNDNDRVKDKASILYGLLQGPAGAQRTSFERRVD